MSRIPFGACLYFLYFYQSTPTNHPSTTLTIHLEDSAATMHLLMPILLALATNTPLIPALTIPSTANTSPRNAVLPESTLKALAAHDALMNRSLPPCRTCDQQKRSLALPSEINPAALAQAARSLEVEEASRQLAARHFGVERREESEGCECDEATNSTASEIPGGVLYPAHFYPDICEEVKVNCMVYVLAVACWQISRCLPYNK